MRVCSVQSRVRTVETVWTCWLTTSASVQPASLVVTANKTLMSVPLSRVLMELAAMTTSTHMSVTVHLASAVFAVISTTTTAQPGEPTLPVLVYEKLQYLQQYTVSNIRFAEAEEDLVTL